MPLLSMYSMRMRMRLYLPLHAIASKHTGLYMLLYVLQVPTWYTCISTISIA